MTSASRWAATTSETVGSSPPAGRRGGAASLSSAEEGRAAENGPAVRRFRRGASLDYGFYVYGARLDAPTQRPRLTTELRLFRDGRPVFTGKPLPFDAAGQADPKRLVAGGSFRLGTDLAPGDYVLQIVVTDLLAEEPRRTASSWIDFEIVE
jgi:hypothetical protein